MKKEQVLKDNVIRDSIVSTPGYANILYSCKLKNVPEVHAIFSESKIAIAEYLDGAGNFGGRDFRLTEIDEDTLFYSGIIYID